MSSLEDSFNLHCCDRRVTDTEAATTVTQHWILLVKSVDTLCDRRCAHADLLREILLLSGIHGADEFVKRRIQKANGGRATFERLENPNEVFLHEDLDFLECLSSAGIVIS